MHSRTIEPYYYRLVFHAVLVTMNLFTKNCSYCTFYITKIKTKYLCLRHITINTNFVITKNVKNIFITFYRYSIFFIHEFVFEKKKNVFSFTEYFKLYNSCIVIHLQVFIILFSVKMLIFCLVVSLINVYECLFLD